jgi:hypothetical protein
MANQQWVSLLNPGQACSGPGALFTESATTAVLSPQSGSADYAVVQPGFQPYGWYPGLLIRVLARGFVTTNATTGTLTVFLRSNKSNAGATFVTYATCPGITTGATTLTGIQWKLEALLRCTAVANSGNTVSTQGELGLQGMTTTPAQMANPFALTAIASEAYAIPMPLASGETAAAVDTTVLQGIQLAATATAISGSIQCTQWIVEALC